MLLGLAPPRELQPRLILEPPQSPGYFETSSASTYAPSARSSSRPRSRRPAPALFAAHAHAQVRPARGPRCLAAAGPSAPGAAASRAPGRYEGRRRPRAPRPSSRTAPDAESAHWHTVGESDRSGPHSTPAAGPKPGSRGSRSPYLTPHESSFSRPRSNIFTLVA